MTSGAAGARRNVPNTDPLAALDAIPPALIPAAIVRLAGRALSSAELDDGGALLTPVEAAALLRTDVRWVYRHAKALGATRLSRRKLRFSRRRVQRFVEARK